MADKSKVAEAYAEVRADLSKLPGDFAKAEPIIKRMLSVSSLKAMRDILTGNISSGIVQLATRGYELQAEKLRAIAKEAEEAKRKLEELAEIHEQAAGDKSKSGAYRDAHAKRAQQLREAAAGKQALADEMTGRAGGVEAAGAKLGGKVALAAQVGVMAIKAIAAVAAAYFAMTVIAAKKASENLKTAQLVRATGQAAGWSTEQLKHMGEQLRKGSQFSGGAIAQAQQALLKHPNIKGAEFERALKTAANLAAVMGTELPQAASELGDILADPIKAAEGALEKYGILLDGVEQGQIKNAVAARDWQKAQNIILDHLKRFDGAAQEASETGIGGFEKLKNSMLAAAGVLGGVNGDIGKLAARAADLLDKFMGLTVVKDIIDISFAPFRIVFGMITDFIESNRADFERWGEQISEIYHNVRDQILEAWEAIKNATKEAMAWILAQTGTSWGEIKQTVTDVLDEISLLTTNFGLTAKYVWLKIQLGAQNAWDFIRDAAAGIAVAFEAAWESVGRGASAAWDQIKGVFTGEGGGKSIAEEMAKGWNEAFAEAAKKYSIGDSAAAKELRKQIDDVRKEMQDARDQVRAKREANKPKEPDMTPNGDKKYKNTKPFQFEFVGFEELSKKIQLALQPDSKEFELQKAGVAAAERAANAGEEGNKKLGEIKDGIGKWGFGFGP